jgi:hypothetical protein
MNWHHSDMFMFSLKLRTWCFETELHIKKKKWTSCSCSCSARCEKTLVTTSSCAFRCSGMPYIFRNMLLRPLNLVAIASAQFSPLPRNWGFLVCSRHPFNKRALLCRQIDPSKNSRLSPRFLDAWCSRCAFTEKAFELIQETLFYYCTCNSYSVIIFNLVNIRATPARAVATHAPKWHSNEFERNNSWNWPRFIAIFISSARQAAARTLL